MFAFLPKFVYQLNRSKWFTKRNNKMWIEKIWMKIINAKYNAVCVVMKGKPMTFCQPTNDSYKWFRCFIHCDRKEYANCGKKKTRLHLILPFNNDTNVLDITVQWQKRAREKKTLFQHLHVNVCLKTVKWTQIKINLP